MQTSFKSGPRKTGQSPSVVVEILDEVEMLQIQIIIFDLSLEVLLMQHKDNYVTLGKCLFLSI